MYQSRAICHLATKQPLYQFNNSNIRIWTMGHRSKDRPKLVRRCQNRNHYFRIDSWVQWYMEGKSVLSTKTFFVFLKSQILTDPSPPRDERQVLSYENVTLLISVIGLCAFWILIRGATVRLWSQIWIWPSFAPLAIILPFLKIIFRFGTKSGCPKSQGIPPNDILTCHMLCKSAVLVFLVDF